MRPLSLSNAQLDAVFAAAQPLNVADRDLFLRDVARALDGQELGDGTVARTCHEIQSNDATTDRRLTTRTRPRCCASSPRAARTA
jgi:hypothetical protein